MRESIKRFVRICADTLPIAEPIYEFGALQVPGQEGFADLRPLFPGRKYVGADMREGPGVDAILNLYDIHLPSESIGTVLMLDTLEHVQFPSRAVEEVHRILNSKGILVMSSVMNFPIHDHPHDYWRFTPEAFAGLLRLFPSSFVSYAGEPDFPHTVVGIGFKGSVSRDAMSEFATRCELWQQHWSNAGRGGWKRAVRLFAPPILMEIYRKMRGAAGRYRASR